RFDLRHADGQRARGWRRRPVVDGGRARSDRKLHAGVLGRHRLLCAVGICDLARRAERRACRGRACARGAGLGSRHAFRIGSVRIRLSHGMALASAHGRLLLRLQRNSFAYFVHETNPRNGLVFDKTRDDWPASIAAMGMALTAYPVGVVRRFIERDDAAARTLTMLRFLADSEQSESSEATGYRGFYYHFLDMQTGRRAWRSELSSVDTALLIAGVLTAAAFFDGSGEREREIRERARMLYERVDWRWMLAGR